MLRKIKQAAHSSIPFTNPNFCRQSTYWWNAQLSHLRLPKVSFCILQNKKRNAIFKREVKITNRNAFIEFTEDINDRTTSEILWEKVFSTGMSLQ